MGACGAGLLVIFHAENAKAQSTQREEKEVVIGKAHCNLTLRFRTKPFFPSWRPSRFIMT